MASGLLDNPAVGCFRFLSTCGNVLRYGEVQDISIHKIYALYSVLRNHSVLVARRSNTGGLTLRNLNSNSISCHPTRLPVAAAMIRIHQNAH